MNLFSLGAIKKNSPFLLHVQLFGIDLNKLDEFAFVYSLVRGLVLYDIESETRNRNIFQGRINTVEFHLFIFWQILCLGFRFPFIFYADVKKIGYRFDACKELGWIDDI